MAISAPAEVPFSQESVQATPGMFVRSDGTHAIGDALPEAQYWPRQLMTPNVRCPQADGCHRHRPLGRAGPVAIPVALLLLPDKTHLPVTGATRLQQHTSQAGSARCHKLLTATVSPAVAHRRHH
eukprot:GHUV01028218.1.p2 GENE.GHUV01028218.1~~GHUV01028218.1.p2  ORF type:complete len:125 (+),score=23.28 GHUV01028218.1:346-720(+)